MQDIKKWIKENIDPPGIEKKNRGSLFSFISRVFGIVNDDALKAFHAFFPYLADLKKLREHGESLSIPKFPHDTEEGYRERVSTASFFLMRAGERGFIMDQLRRHFGEHFNIREEFLQIFVDVAEMSDSDREWIHSFLDGILDPNIQFTVADWLRFNAHAHAALVPCITREINILPSEKEAYAHIALTSFFAGQIYVPANENESHLHITAIPKVDCSINILSQEVIL
jgi:hypothetical protein